MNAIYIETGSKPTKILIRWRQPAGTVLGIVGFIVWVGLGAFIARTASELFEQHATTTRVLVYVTAIMFALGGLVIVWSIAEQIEFWRLGYRVQQLSRKSFVSAVDGSKAMVYEERTPTGQIQGLPFLWTTLDDGYPPIGEVSLPRNEDWDAQMPSWAIGRKTEIIQHMNKCFGAERSRTRFVDHG